MARGQIVYSSPQWGRAFGHDGNVQEGREQGGGTPSEAHGSKRIAWPTRPESTGCHKTQTRYIDTFHPRYPICTSVFYPIFHLSSSLVASFFFFLFFFFSIHSLYSTTFAVTALTITLPPFPPLILSFTPSRFPLSPCEHPGSPYISLYT